MKRHTCTKDDPWTKEKGKYSEHPDAFEYKDQSDGWPSGDIAYYECPNCKLRFSVELPQ